MAEWSFARLVAAHNCGFSLDRYGLSLPRDHTLITVDDLPNERHLAAPAERIPILARSASYAGQPLGVVVGSDWHTVDTLRAEIPQNPPASPCTTSERSTPLELPPRKTKKQTLIVAEDAFETAPQLHWLHAPYWVQATRTDQGFEIVVPTQWPAHVARSVCLCLGLAKREVTVLPVSMGVTRDAAVLFPSLLACLAATAARVSGRPVLLTTTVRESFLSGGRAGASILLRSVLRDDGTLRETAAAVTAEMGAFGAFQEEAAARVEAPHNLLYTSPHSKVVVTYEYRPDVPLSIFEGLIDSQFAFAREMHVNSICINRSWDPVDWRLNHLPDGDQMGGLVLKDAAERGDYRRRHASNQARAHRGAHLAVHGFSTRGIGIAFASQQSGLTTPISSGSITVRLEQDGIAVLRCSLPTANPALRRYWRSLVAANLDISESDVLVDDEFVDEKKNSGPAILSRGVSFVPRAIRSACDAIRRQRFRAPLPIEVNRSIRLPKSGKTPADFGRAYASAVVEVEIDPNTVEVDIRSVHMSLYAGTIVNRSSAESEIRRGVYQALAWTLHEGAKENTRTGYDTTFRGSPPRISISFVDSTARDVPAGLGELAFSSVPAAAVGAISQASGVRFIHLPVDLTLILKQLEEE